MLVELSPAAYMALCALVQDALSVDSDATLLLRKVQAELLSAKGNFEQPELPAHVRELAMMGKNTSGV